MNIICVLQHNVNCRPNTIEHKIIKQLCTYTGWLLTLLRSFRQDLDSHEFFAFKSSDSSTSAVIDIFGLNLNLQLIKTKQYKLRQIKNDCDSNCRRLPLGTCSYQPTVNQFF